MNFLEPHPRTVEWWRLRETCRRCANLRRPEPTTRHAVVMLCLATGKACIDSREIDGQCGPGAALFA